MLSPCYCDFIAKSSLLRVLVAAPFEPAFFLSLCIGDDVKGQADGQAIDGERLS